MTEYNIDVHNKLEELATKYLSSGDWNLQPLVTHIDNKIDSVTISSEDCFKLNEPVGGKIKQHHTDSKILILEDNKRTSIIHRSLLDNNGCETMIKNEAQFVLSMSFLINNALIELHDRVGCLRYDKSIKITYPGTTKYFNYNDKYKAYEFRVHVIKKEE